MTMADEPKKIVIKIDGKDCEAMPGETILPVALRHGIEIPHYCYHPALSIVAQCRLCLVQVEGMPKLQASCSTPVRDGLVVGVQQNEQARKARNEMLELLLANHPLDCPVCDKGGECDLQDFTMRYGPSHSRYIEPKRVMPDLNLGREVLNRNRCVVCTRCIRVCSEVAGVEELTLAQRGNHTYVSPFADHTVENLLSGNMADVCPVGAITTKDFRFRARVWDLQTVDSICGLCSRGCNITVWQKDNRLHRITPRYNPEVNSYWMCDIGRFEYRFQSDEGRLMELRSNGTTGTWDTVVKKAAEILNAAVTANQSIGFLLTSSVSMEEAILVREMKERHFPNAVVAIVSPAGEEIRYKTFRISGDRGPNARGLQTLFDQKMGENLEKVRKCDVIYLLNSAPQDPFQQAGLKETDASNLKALIQQDILTRTWTRQATLVLPQATSFEMSGTWVNEEGRSQTFQKAVEPPGAAKPGWWILARVLTALGYDRPLQKFEDVRKMVSDDSAIGIQPAGPRIMGKRPWHSRYTYNHWGGEKNG